MGISPRAIRRIGLLLAILAASLAIGRGVATGRQGAFPQPLDGAASTAFFGDETRLHRDLLFDGAT
jgi:hypothetical protein